MYPKWVLIYALTFTLGTTVEAKEWWTKGPVTTISPHVNATDTYVIRKRGKVVGRIFVTPGQEYEVKDKDGNTIGTFTPSLGGGRAPWQSK